MNFETNCAMYLLCFPRNPFYFEIQHFSIKFLAQKGSFQISPLSPLEKSF